MTRLDESLLRDLPPFSKPSQAQIRDVLARATPARHPEGTRVFSEGLKADRFFLLLDGFVRVIRTTDEGEQVIALHIPPGQLFGIALALGKTHYPATAVCATEAVTLSWPARLWQEFVAEYDGFATETYRTVGQRMGELHTRIADLSTRAVEQRVASALLRMVSQSGREVEGGIEIGFPVTRSNISDITGTTLHTVSRLLAGWEKQGVLESRRRHVKVIDLQALGRLGGQTGWCD